MSSCEGEFLERTAYHNGKAVGDVFHNIQTNELRESPTAPAPLKALAGKEVVIKYG